MKKFQSTLAITGFAALLMASVIWIGSLQSCSALNQLAGLTKLEFKLMDCQHVSLCGIDLTNKHSASDFSVMDGISLLNAFHSNSFPLTLTVDVGARNPNPATGSNALSSIQLTQFPWTLSIDQHPTISGGIGAAVGVPANGTTEVIPLQASIDLKQFFADKGYSDILNLATALSGQGGVAHLQLQAQPTVGTPLGSYKYPSPITIVNTQFNGGK